jgi:hypothetical protein
VRPALDPGRRRVHAEEVASPLRLLCLVGYHVPAKRFRREYNDEGETAMLICPRCGKRKDPGSGATLRVDL